MHPLLSHLDAADQRLLIRAIDKRRPGIDGRALLMAFLALLAWLAFSAPFLAALDRLLDKSLARAQWQANATGILSVLMSLGMATFLAILVFRGVRYRSLTKEIRRSLYTPLCFWCGHNVTGVPHTRHIVVCPECGRPSPIAPGADNPIKPR